MSTYIVISTAQTDLGLRSRTFSLKINELPTFSEIIQAWQYLTREGFTNHIDKLQIIQLWQHNIFCLLVSEEAMF